NVHHMRGSNELDAGANEAVEVVEAIGELVVIVERHIAGMRVERESAKAARETRHLEIDPLRVDALDLKQVAKRRHARVDRMEEPEAGDLLPGEIGHCPGPAAAHGARFLIEHGHEALHDL